MSLITPPAGLRARDRRAERGLGAPHGRRLAAEVEDGGEEQGSQIPLVLDDPRAHGRRV